MVFGLVPSKTIGRTITAGDQSGSSFSVSPQNGYTLSANYRHYLIRFFEIVGDILKNLLSSESMLQISYFPGFCAKYTIGFYSLGSNDLSKKFKFNSAPDTLDSWWKYNWNRSSSNLEYRKIEKRNKKHLRGFWISFPDNLFNSLIEFWIYNFSKC